MSTTDTSAATARLFVALPLPEAIRALAAELMVPPAGRDVRWTPPEQLHVTLRFLGDTPVEKIAPLAERLATVRVEPFLLPLEDVGAFPSKSPPRVLWLGLGAGHPRLHQLRQQIDDLTIAAGLAADLRTFHPHITLARCPPTPAGASAAARWLKQHRDYAGPPFRVTTFALCASELRPGGAVHRTIRQFALAK